MVVVAVLLFVSGAWVGVVGGFRVVVGVGVFLLGGVVGIGIGVTVGGVVGIGGVIGVVIGLGLIVGGMFVLLNVSYFRNVGNSIGGFFGGNNRGLLFNCNCLNLCGVLDIVDVGSPVVMFLVCFVILGKLVRFNRIKLDLIEESIGNSNNVFVVLLVDLYDDWVMVSLFLVLVG